MNNEVAENPFDALYSDLCAVETAMDLARDKYTSLLLKGETTRAITTAFNAEQGKRAQRRDELRRIIAAKKIELGR